MKNNYTEQTDSQTPATNLLRKMGYTYISPESIEKERNGIRTGVLMEKILAERLMALNRFEYKGKTYPFSQSNIQQAITALGNVAEAGLVQSNEAVYDLITLGKSFSETIQGDQRAYTLKYIDWEKPANNVFHIAEEFELEGLRDTRRPDIVLFVNGIPFVVIENKRRDKNEAVEEAISQHIRNQRKEEGVPRLYYYAQLLLAVQPNKVKYGATGTPAKFWSVWKEDHEKKVEKLISQNKNGLEAENRLATAQDQSLYSLCEPKRLLDIVYKYMVFDGPDKKVCRYQQYFAVQDTLKQVRQTTRDDTRKGGVIWHTTGSGKSLTMVMLSKALALQSDIPSPRVVVVTDRINLDKQIYKTFLNCGKTAKKARSGAHLIELLQDKGNEVITTIIDKFQTARKHSGFSEGSKNIFVLVDESHRSQYGTANALMRKMLPNACFIGFTGTPLMKTEKNTARKFGGFIHKYTIDQAVEDGAVLPLLHEGRSAKLSVNKKEIDKGFERLAGPLSDEAGKDLKRKFSSLSKLFESERVVEEIAYDISKHFSKNWAGTGFKAQLAAPKIDTAIRYQKYFENQTDPELKLNTKVVFTPPDSRKDNDDVWKESKKESRNYWNKIVEKHGDQESYEKWVIEKFKDETEDVQIIIVVSKLLTGFDAPRNAVLYLAKPLYGHNLLQAIARVNRLFEGKGHGYIIDYVGVLDDLHEARTTYSAFEEFDGEDIENAVIDMTEEVRKVPLRHSEVVSIFNPVSNKQDTEALERHLAPKDLRDRFYEVLSGFSKILQSALSSDVFYEEFNEAQIAFYKAELKRFHQLRSSVQLRYSDAVSYREYEPRVKKLLDTYVGVKKVYQTTGQVDIFNQSQVAEALESYGKTPASKADYIASKMKKVVHEKMEKDEAFYKKFSELIENTIRAFHEGRMDEQAYLEKVMEIRDDLESGHQEGIPKSVQNDPRARAFFGALTDTLKTMHGDEALAQNKERLAQAGKAIDGLVSKLIIRDWKKNLDVQHKMENAIEDYLIEHRQDLGIDLTFDEIDAILTKSLKVAKNNY
jgi:type I restriction enzyme R subunit